MSHALSYQESAISATWVTRHLGRLLAALSLAEQSLLDGGNGDWDAVDSLIEDDSVGLTVDN
jgi:hypothetical protein